MAQPRVILWDLEFMHLNWDASCGVIFCMGWKVLGERTTHLESILDYPGKDMLDDSNLCKRLSEILSEADMWVTQNGIKCDVPFLQTRLAINNLPVLRPVAHKDIMYTSRFKLKLYSNSLFNIQQVFNLSEEKSPVRLYEWLKALIGNKQSLKYIQHHCVQDVKVLELAYKRLLPLMLAHPRLHGYGPCNKCGSTSIQKRGLYITTGRKPKQRIFCNGCGGWETRDITKAEWQAKTPKTSTTHRS